MTGIDVWGGDTVTGGFLLGNSPSSLNTFESKQLTLYCNYLSVVSFISRECGRTQELLSCDLEVCPVGAWGMKVEVLQGLTVGVGQGEGQTQKQMVASAITLYPYGEPRNIAEVWSWYEHNCISKYLPNSTIEDEQENTDGRKTRKYVIKVFRSEVRNACTKDSGGGKESKEWTIVMH